MAENEYHVGDRYDPRTDSYVPRPKSNYSEMLQNEIDKANVKKTIADLAAASSEEDSGSGNYKSLGFGNVRNANVERALKLLSLDHPEDASLKFLLIAGVDNLMVKQDWERLGDTLDPGWRRRVDQQAHDKAVRK